MAEFRHDPIHRRWVIVTVDRKRGPKDFEIPRRVPDEGFCPFCEGQESKTPPEIYAVRSGSNPDRPGWKARVFLNKYPALTGQAEEIERGAQGIYDWINGLGSHEIIVDHPQHHVLLQQMGLEHLAILIETYRHRLAALMEDERFRYVMIFKNHGVSSGASLNHQHTQLIAMPVIPRIAAMALAISKQHFHLKERCLFCDMIDQELDDGSRIVAQNDDFVCFTPYASRFPFEMNIMPKKHHHDFASMDDRLLRPAAEIVHQAIGRLAALFGDPPFNLNIHTAPNTNQLPRRSGYWSTLSHDWHWQIEISPRLGASQGFEWGTGLFINPTPPEEAARFLREVTL